MGVPDEAVEAAVEALMSTIAYRVNPFMPPRYLADMGVRGVDAEAVRKRAFTAALEAAAPHMLAEAWAQAYAAGFLTATEGRSYDAITSNPHRSQE